jgi:hypothetical protein
MLLDLITFLELSKLISDYLFQAESKVYNKHILIFFWNKIVTVFFDNYISVEVKFK